MERPDHENVQWFIGTEVEHTPAFGMKTLFVVGIQDVVGIKEQYEKHRCEHIYFGANHTFAPESDADWTAWENMIKALLSADYWCTLDYDVFYVKEVLELGFDEYNNFINMISVKLPYIKQFNYNATLKLDDIDFDATNPGVWTHSLHKLMDRRKFTPWTDYAKDEVIK